MKKFLRKKKRKILYAAYLEQLNKESKNTISIVEDQKNEGAKKKKKSVVIEIYSLSHACGCSFISKKIAEYLINSGKTACIISNTIVISEMDDIPIYENKNPELYEKYEFIINDIGTGSYDRSFSNRKIMVCLHKEEYEKKLAEFLRNERGEEWVYIFNFVTSKQRKEVMNLMEDYKCFLLPYMDFLTPEKEVDKVLKKVVRG